MSGCLRRALAAAAIAVLAAGCGVTTDSAPRAIARDQVKDLLEPTTSANVQAQGPEVLHLFFIRDQHLTEVLRRGVASDPRATLEQLLAGPSARERNAEQLTTFIPPHTRLLSVDLPSAGVLVISLSKEMDDLSGVSARNAYAQIVFTATATPGIRQVAFQSKDRLIEVPTSGRNKKVVTRADYGQLLG